MKTYVVYDHISPSGKHYVGQTCQRLERRWGKNGARYLEKRNGCYAHPAFAAAIIKYGWDKFQHIIVYTTNSKSECDYTEEYLIKWYKIHGLSYNITDGATPSPQKYFSEEELKEAQKGWTKKYRDEHREECRERWRNYYYAHKEESAQRRKEKYYSTPVEERQKHHKEQYQEYKEYHRQKNKEYRESHKEYFAQKAREYRNKDRDAYNAKRREQYKLKKQRNESIDH